MWIGQWHGQRQSLASLYQPMATKNHYPTLSPNTKSQSQQVISLHNNNTCATQKPTCLNPPGSHHKLEFNTIIHETFAPTPSKCIGNFELKMQHKANMGKKRQKK